jgi:hypothetical protein
VNVRLAVVTLITAGALAYLLRSVGGSGDSEGPPESVRSAPSERAAVEPSAAPSSSGRNVFEYWDGGARPAGPPPAVLAPAPVAPAAAAPAPEPPPAVRLVGVLRRGTLLRAALTIQGDTVVLAPGESAAGYSVVSIDEEEGVRVKAPDGTAIVLAPPPQ